MSAAKQGVLKAVGIITILTLFSRCAGLLRKLAQSWAMSDSAVATAYDTANTVPNVLFEIAAGGALAGAVIPLISGYLAQSMRREASETASALITWVLLIGIPVAILIALAAAPISAVLFGVDADSQIVSLSTMLLRVFAIQIPLYGLSVVFTGILQAHNKFTLPALSPLLSSIVVIGVFAVYGYSHGPSASPASLSAGAIAWLAWGTTAGVVIFSLPQLIPAMKLLDLHLRLKFPPGVAWRTVRLAGAGLGALLAQQMAIVSIMIVANIKGGVGAYATFNYAWAMFMVPYAVLAVPVATATFPRIAAEVSGALVSSSPNAQITPMKSTGLPIAAASLIARSTRLVGAMGITAAASLIVLARPAQIILEMNRSIEGLDVAMVAMGVGVAGYSIMYHGARVLYALERGRWVILSNSLAWGWVILGLILIGITMENGRVRALIGIGASISVGMLIGACAVIYAIRRVAGKVAVVGIAQTYAAVLVCEILAAIPAWCAVQWILDSMGTSFIAAVLSALGGAAILAIGLGAFLWITDRSLFLPRSIPMR